MFRWLDRLGDACVAVVASARAMTIIIGIMSCALVGCAILAVVTAIQERDLLYAVPSVFSLFMAAVLAALARRIWREGL